MEYISVGQASEKWGISRARINILLKSGRIPGAFIVGKSWVIPSGAEKPADWRSAPVGKRREPESYHFPIPYNSYYHNYGVYEAMRHHQRGDYAEAEEILSRLRNKPFDKYYRISVLYLSCYNYLYLNEYEKCLTTLFELRMLLSEKDPHRRELSFITHELNFRFGPSGVLMCEDFIGEAYTYSDECKPYIATLNLCSQVMQNLEGSAKFDCTLYELSCDSMDEVRYSYYMMISHIYLALFYAKAENEEAIMAHLRKAIDLAVRYGYHIALASFYSRFPVWVDKALEGFYPELRNKIRGFAEAIQASRDGFLASQSKPQLLSALTDEDYRYILYAVRKKTNREVAELEHTSLHTVSQNFLILYDKLEVTHKSGLVKFYSQLFGLNS